MSSKNIRKFFKPRNLISLSVPVGIMAANLFFPLTALARQILVVVVMVWFFIELDTVSVLLGWLDDNDVQ